jgi:hypothetical protein
MYGMRTQEETEVAATAFRRGDPGYEDARRATCRTVWTCLWVQQAASIHCVGSPNSKPHLMLARRTIVDADMRVVSFRR